jgi:4-hydroxy-2,2'-bipyrrole-5-carbaldehyde O-methyltransferase
MLRRDLRAFVRQQFLAAALQAGILEALRMPQEVDDLAGRLGFSQRATLRTLLDLGVAVGELAHGPSGYRLRGAAARALVRPRNDALCATLLELIDYHALVYRGLGEHLRVGRERDFLVGRADLIQRSSRIVEPVLGAFARELVRGRRSVRILELGCGSGVYLKHALRANPHAYGVGVEAAAEVVVSVRAAVGRWGLGDRLQILHADARQLPPEVGGKFELITLYNNIYYFEGSERRSLLADLGGRLTEDGQLAIVSMMRGATPVSLDLDLVLAATRGCTPLPTESELRATLGESGFTDIRRYRLLPGEPFLAFVCAAPRVHAGPRRSALNRANPDF